MQNNRLVLPAHNLLFFSFDCSPKGSADFFFTEISVAIVSSALVIFQFAICGDLSPINPFKSKIKHWECTENY